MWKHRGRHFNRHARPLFLLALTLIAKGGREVWIQASYNPILDLNGHPFKVVKYATDITSQKNAVTAMMSDAMMLSQAAVEGKGGVYVQARQLGDLVGSKIELPEVQPVQSDLRTRDSKDSEEWSQQLLVMAASEEKAASDGA